jgi:hypothetical protein
MLEIYFQGLAQLTDAPFFDLTASTRTLEKKYASLWVNMLI